eukprot:CAMPEP_0180128216 /NCGR_PEP_ID=MMETSP0986-20121125/6637_1 /TAXON_ID=697907 /ORGANISM="non described non described, Strain CCMP2293" /LENGTH=493 /DNA_ID=CAMNT_0022067749 /DNA_START=8 /DNA_END=1489 /DNA_ORIENTATION=-
MTFPASASAFTPGLQNEIPGGALGARHARYLEGVCGVNARSVSAPTPAAAFLLRGGDSGDAAPSSFLSLAVRPVAASAGFAGRLMRPFGSLARACSRGWRFVLRMVGRGPGEVGFSNLPSVVTWNNRPEFMQGRKKHLLLEAELPYRCQAALPEGTGGQRYACLGANETEFRMFLAHASNLSTAAVAALEVTDRCVDLRDEGVRLELRQLWGNRTLLLKDVSFKQALAPDKSMAAELKGYITRMRDVLADPFQGPELREWLEQAEGLGLEKATACLFDATRDVVQTREGLLPMLHWFRERYPYYNQKCFECGTDATCRLGCTMASRQEVQRGKAGRTELFFCPSCGITRFARYTDLRTVLEEKRGRCGEYSVAMFHLLEAAGYTVRWVVDWKDHVWDEVLVQGEWVHIDPCEAAVNDKRMYVGWGKQHTYVVALGRTEVEDVTEAYTDSLDAARKRRDLSDHDLAEVLRAASTDWASGNIDAGLLDEWNARVG